MKKIMKNISLNSISVFLLLSFPACLVTGPLLSEISMNLINIFFLYQVFKEKNFKFIKEKFFIIFIIFYLYICFNIFLSDYLEQIVTKHIFYFRHIIFIFAVVNLLSKNKNLMFLFYKFLMVTILVVSIDGIIQFIFGYNSFGYPKIRPDRLSGFFVDKMVLGSYIARLLPLLLGLFIYNYKLFDKKILLIGIFTLIISFVTIILSGERMAFFTSFIYILSAFILLNYTKKIKLLLIILAISIVSILITYSPILLDRHFVQTFNQVNFKFDSKNFFSNFSFYKDTYQTAFNGYKDNKIFGQGARSFRFFCSDKKLESNTTNYYYKKKIFKKNEKIFINQINFETHVEGKKLTTGIIKKGDVLFTYLSNKELKNYVLNLNNFPHLKNQLTNDSLEYKIISSNIIVNLENNTIEELKKLSAIGTKYITLSYNKNGCTSHPHNFYLQLLSEIGTVGFMFLFSLFCYFVFLICKSFIQQILNKRNILTNFQICLLLCFIITLLPMIPNGNFFNNWLSMIMFLPAGFYIFSLKKTKQ